MRGPASHLVSAACIFRVCLKQNWIVEQVAFHTKEISFKLMRAGT